MADDEPYVRRSVKDIAAGLKGDQVGRVPITSKPAKPIVKPKINRSISANAPLVTTNGAPIPNQPAGNPSDNDAVPSLPPRRPGERPPPPSVPPRSKNGTAQEKPPVPGLPPRRPTDGPPLPSRTSATSSTNGDALADRPSLPVRTFTDKPELPNRRASQASLASTTSAISTVSKLSTSSARTNGTARTASSGDQSRVRAPAFDPASLPPLPPKREKKEDKELAAQTPALPSRGTGNTWLNKVNKVVRNEPPPPSLPTRPESAAPDQPPRRLPPTVIPPARPRPDRPNGQSNGTNGVNGINGHASQGVITLNARNFDEIVLRPGRPALVDFSANFCHVCKKLDPTWDQLGSDFSHVSDQLIIGRVDCAVEKSLGTRYNIEAWPTLYWFDGKGGAPEQLPLYLEYKWLAQTIEDKTGFKPQKGSPGTGLPPPIPLGTRPDLSAIMHTKPKPAMPRAEPAFSAPMTGCMICRDFSGPDNHAAKFPRQNVRSLNTLAHELTAPFNNLTDKARAIFTWMHHNIAYDVDAFFGNCIRGVTPLESVQSGAAVCSGYAGLYADLALKAGLECVMVVGHGKGFGYKELKPGEPVPPESQGHAWNAVKIDFGGPGGNGQKYWKLLDACWGAGNVSDDQRYEKAFKPNQFTANNINFGRSHFPEDRSQQFREDNRTITWQQYYVGDAGGQSPQIFGDVAPREGLDSAHFKPSLKRISLDPNAHAATRGIVRFQFQRVCDHWKPEVNGAGKDLIYILPVQENGKAVHVPFETNGTYWWCDVHVNKLGKKGDSISIGAINTMGDKTSRGMSRDEFLRLRGKVGSGWSWVASWDLV